MLSYQSSSLIFIVWSFLHNVVSNNLLLLSVYSIFWLDYFIETKAYIVDEVDKITKNNSLSLNITYFCCCEFFLWIQNEIASILRQKNKNKSFRGIVGCLRSFHEELFLHCENFRFCFTYFCYISLLRNFSFKKDFLYIVLKNMQMYCNLQFNYVFMFL